jgi:MbtH protein
MNEDKKNYYVVKNMVGQYSIWPSEKKLPNGWNIEGTSGSREECLEYIERVWIDMRPLNIP